jgi:alpha-glucosidase
MRIVFDLVINHTSDQHPWFVEARSSKTSPKHDWYIWKPRTDPETGKRLKRPNNWVSQFEFRSAWWDNESTDEWYLGTFTRHQPEVNWRNPELRAAMFDVARFWLDLGVDGFRMDVVNWYVKDALFRSNPFSLNANPDIFQKHIHDRSQPESHDICREIRKISDSYPGERVLIGEIFTRNPEDAASYQGNGTDELHLAFNMEMLYLSWKPKALAQALGRWYAALPAQGWPNFTLSNHDQKRHASRFAAKSPEAQAGRMQIAAMFLLCVRGTPFIYYGEEIGMRNSRIPKRELRDPTGITFWPLDLGRDGERTPMQWTGGTNAGFTGAGVRPWMRVGADWRTVNVEVQQHDPGSLWHWYRRLIEIRSQQPVLQTGHFSFTQDGRRSVIAFRRSAEELPNDRATPPGTIDCYLNFSPNPRRVFLPADAQVLLGNRRDGREILARGALVLAGYEALLVSF